MRISSCQGLFRAEDVRFLTILRIFAYSSTVNDALNCGSSFVSKIVSPKLLGRHSWRVLERIPQLEMARGVETQITGDRKRGNLRNETQLLYSFAIHVSVAAKSIVHAQEIEDVNKWPFSTREYTVCGYFESAQVSVSSVRGSPACRPLCFHFRSKLLPSF